MPSNHPFQQTEWPLEWSGKTTDHVQADIRDAIARGRAAIKKIEDLPPEEANFANTFLALEEASRLVQDPWSLVAHLDSVRDQPERRKAVRELLPEISAFSASIPLNPLLYARLRAAADRDWSSLDSEARRYAAETLRDFEDAGAEKEEETRRRLEAMDNEFADKTKTFSENVLDATNAYEKIVHDESRLAGLPASLKEAAREDALRKGYGSDKQPAYRFTLQIPSLLPVLRYVHEDGLRRELYEAFTAVGRREPHDNEPLIREILALRAEKASLLGRAGFPEWILSRRMARDPQTALAFIEDLHARTKPAFDREIDEILDCKARHGGNREEFLPWEAAYWTERLRHEKFAFEEEELRPYFPLPRVMEGLFHLVESLFGVRVREAENAPEAWHPDVRTWRLEDADSAKVLGYFYTDWYPREDKRGGAWMNPLLAGKRRENGQITPHIGLVAGNLTPPVGDQPALLTHRDVETLFHEFGHLLHHLLSEVSIPGLGGTNVAWDFVELPSQIMENWCWERESLDLFARHFESGEPLPEELFRKLIASRRFGAAQFQMRQLSFAKLDMELHLLGNPGKETDLDAFADKVLANSRPPFSVPAPNNLRSFSHLFADANGYAAGYYSYKWAEVLDADAFTRFQAEGLLNPFTGREFREAILARGNSAPPEDLFRDFMGRDPKPQALLERLGLAAE